MDRMRDRTEAFRRALKERGLKETAQRGDIARVFFEQSGHVSVEELHAQVRRVNRRVGYATVHRTVRLLKDLGFAVERHFGDGQARYERLEGEQPHDHLICERCGRIVEFQSEQIEALQRSVARALGFLVSRRRTELYGVCRDCREGRTRRGARAAARVIHRL